MQGSESLWGRWGQSWKNSFGKQNRAFIEDISKLTIRDQITGLFLKKKISAESGCSPSFIPFLRFISVRQSVAHAVPSRKQNARNLQYSPVSHKKPSSPLKDKWGEPESSQRRIQRENVRSCLVLLCSALVASGVRAPPSPPLCLLSAPSLGGWGHGAGAGSPAALLLHPLLPDPAARRGTCCAPGGLLPLWPGQGGLPDHCSGWRRLRAPGDLCCIPLLWRQAHRTLCEYRGVCFCWCVLKSLVMSVHALGSWQLDLKCCGSYKSLRELRCGTQPNTTLRYPQRICIRSCRISRFPLTGVIILLCDFLFTSAPFCTLRSLECTEAEQETNY